MRSLDSIDTELRKLINRIYSHPYMHCKSPGCVESVLYVAHRCWSLLHERESEFQNLYNTLIDKHRAVCGLYHQYREATPEGSDDEAYRFIFERWTTISTSLGLKTPESWDHLSNRST